MLIGSTFYYRLSGDRLVRCAGFDSSSTCPTSVAADEVADWGCENGPQSASETLVGAKVAAVAAKHGITIADWIRHHGQRAADVRGMVDAAESAARGY